MHTVFYACVATVLTVYGIETRLWATCEKLVKGVATVLTVYGIETVLRLVYV